METSVCVISKDGKKLMPTVRFRKVRHLLKEGRAKIYSRRPFTIQLLYDTTDYTQPIEICEDTGYLHVGVSIKSEKREFISHQYDLLKDEKEKHDDKRKYRRTRRNRLRYRSPRFNNRKRDKGWLAPSLKNKAERQIDIITRYSKVMPITDVYLECGQFDIKKMEAIEKGEPLPVGKDYQNSKYSEDVDTLRQAVFQRDDYTCRICGKNSFKDNVILRMHHALYWMGIHGNTLDECITVCSHCHTPENHQKDGLLYGYTPNKVVLKEATFMNVVRWYIYTTVRDTLTPQGVNVHMCYGTTTKQKRRNLNLDKSHVNDAYSMGELHPEIRAEFVHFVKVRRHNRVLCKFYDAEYIDSRTGKKVKGKDLTCGRTNRNHKTDTENLHKYRKEKLKKGRTVLRTIKYDLTSGAKFYYEGRWYTSSGIRNKGRYVVVKEKVLDVKTSEYITKERNIPTSKLTKVRYTNGWKEVA